MSLRVSGPCSDNVWSDSLGVAAAGRQSGSSYLPVDDGDGKQLLAMLADTGFQPAPLTAAEVLRGASGDL